MKANTNSIAMLVVTFLSLFGAVSSFANDQSGNKTLDSEVQSQAQSIPQQTSLLTPDDLIALKTKLSALEILAERQKFTIENLQSKIDLYEEKPLEKNINYPIWTSILLGSSALLMTIVGIGIAILSLIGYRQIVKKGVKAAIEAASETAKVEAAKGLADSVEKAVEDLTDRGYFEPIVNELVLKFMYRGMEPNNLAVDADVQAEQGE